MKTIISLFKNLAKKYRSLSLQMKAVIWFSFCSLFQRGINIITMPIYTRLMSKEQYGLISVYNAYSVVVVIIATLYLQSAAMNNAFVKLKYTHEKIVSVFQSLSATTSLFLLIIYLCFKQDINRFIGLPQSVVLLMFVSFVMWSPYNYWLLKKRYSYEYKAPVITSLITAVVTPTISVLSVLIWKGSGKEGEIKIIAEIIVLCLIGLVFYVINYKKQLIFYDKELWKFAITFNIPLIPCFLSETLLNQVDRIMISQYCGSEYSAIYSIAYSIAALVLIISTAISMAFVPWQYQNLRSKNYQGLNKVGLGVLVLMAFLLLLITFFGPEVTFMLAGSEYTEGVRIIPTLAASVFFNFMFQLFYRVELYCERKWMSVTAVLISASLNIVLNAKFIPVFGYTAAGYITLLCHIVLCLLHYIFYKYICIKYLDITRIYNEKIILVLSGVVIFCAAIMPFMYAFVTLRVTCVMLICILIYFYRMKLYQIVVAFLESKY